VKISQAPTVNRVRVIDSINSLVEVVMLDYLSRPVVLADDKYQGLPFLAVVVQSDERVALDVPQRFYRVTQFSRRYSQRDQFISPLANGDFAAPRRRIVVALVARKVGSCLFQRGALHSW